MVVSAPRGGGGGVINNQQRGGRPSSAPGLDPHTDGGFVREGFGALPRTAAGMPADSVSWTRVEGASNVLGASSGFRLKILQVWVLCLWELTHTPQASAVLTAFPSPAPTVLTPQLHPDSVAVCMMLLTVPLPLSEPRSPGTGLPAPSGVPGTLRCSAHLSVSQPDPL